MPADSAIRAVNRRQNEIMGLLHEVGRVSVEELSARFGVTPQTIRRDLNELCQIHQLTRVHGGAMIASSVANLAYDARKLVAQPVKRLIGAAAARLIPDNSSLLINIGTTTEEVARALAQHSGLLVITNNLHVAAELYRFPGVELIIAGGTIRRSDGGIVGAPTVEHIRQFRVDLAVIGTSAIDPDGTLLDFDSREVQVSRTIIECARKVMLVADSSKFVRTAPVRIAHLSDVDMLVTDRLSTPESVELCERLGIEVIETASEEEFDASI